MMSVTNAPQNAPDSGVAAALLSVVRNPEPASALRPLVMTLMPSRKRPTPPRTEMVVDIRGPLWFLGQSRVDFRQFLLLFRVDFRVSEIELFHRLHNRSSNNQAGKPFVVGRHYEPR